MKLLTHIQCLELLPADPATAAEAADLFPSVLAADVLPNYYRTAFAEGWVFPTTVFLSGKKLGLIGWHRTADGGLFIDCIVAFQPLPDTRVMWDALEILEREMKPAAAYVRCLTMRRGLVELATRHGFESIAVMLHKPGNSPNAARH